MQIAERREAAIRHYIEAYNNFDTAGMLTHLHPDVVFENSSNNQITLTLNGLAAFRQQAEKAAQFFTSRHQQIIHLSANNDRVEATIRYEGTVAVDIPNGPKKGETIALNGTSVFTFSGDKIIRLTDSS